MVYKFFDKMSTSGSSIFNNNNNNDDIKQNHLDLAALQLAEELHKSIIRNYKKIIINYKKSLFWI